MISCRKSILDLWIDGRWVAHKKVNEAQLLQRCFSKMWGVLKMDQGATIRFHTNVWTSDVKLCWWVPHIPLNLKNVEVIYVRIGRSSPAMYLVH